MAYVITEPCIGVCDTACVDVCPTDAIHGPISVEDIEAAEEKGEKAALVAGIQLFIDPEECISCGACEDECPVEAIFDEDDVPEEWEKYIEMNANFFE